MAETAAHLVDHVIPPLPVRQWVLSVPKRLRWYLEREPQAVSAVLHILLRVVDGHLRRSSDAGPDARFGAVSFIHRFGASLNRHVHFDENHPGSRASRALSGAPIRSRRIGHCCVIDGVFEPAEQADDAGPQAVRFRAAADLTPQAVAAITEQVRIRVLRWFARSGVIEPDTEMSGPPACITGWSASDSRSVAASIGSARSRSTSPPAYSAHSTR